MKLKLKFFLCLVLLVWGKLCICQTGDSVRIHIDKVVFENVDTTASNQLNSIIVEFSIQNLSEITIQKLIITIGNTKGSFEVLHDTLVLKKYQGKFYFMD